MPRTALPLGAWGGITAKKDDATGRWRASCRFKDLDGITRTYSKFAATRGKAENALLMAMRERQRQGRQPEETVTLAQAACRWLTSVEPPQNSVDERGDLIEGGVEGTLRRQTWDQYDSITRRHILPALGALPLREVRTSTCDAFLRSLTVAGKGSSNARIGKTVLRQIMSYAIRHDLYTESNPVVEVDRTPRNRKEPEALDLCTLRAVREAMRNWRTETGLTGPAPDSTLSDVVDVLLGTGARIGEVLALRWQDVDLGGEVGTVTINGTIVEPRKGPKFRQPYTKTIDGDRVIPVPRFCVDVLLRRRVRSPDANTADAVFWSRRGTYMQGSSIRRSMRAALLEAGIDPGIRITPHAFRRTVATLLAREVSDGASAQLLGHADVRTTHKHYIQKLREVGDYRYVLQQLSPGETGTGRPS